MSNVGRMEEPLLAWHDHIVAKFDNLRPARDQSQFSKSSLSSGNDEHERWLINECIDWLVENEYWKNNDYDKNTVIDETHSSLSRLARLIPTVIKPTEINGRTLALSVAACSAFGALLCSAIGLMIPGASAVGIFVGGAAGAYFSTRAFEMARHKPKFAEYVRLAFTISGITLVSRAGWQTLRGSISGGISSAAGSALLWGLAVLLRPVQSHETIQVIPKELTLERLTWESNLALCLLWSCPDRLPLNSAPISDKHEIMLAGPICAALSDLRNDLEANATPQDLRHGLECLFQRFEEDGYEWQFIADGTSFEENMANMFDTFGTIKPGEPIKSRQAATLYRGKLIRRGELRRAKL